MKDDFIENSLTAMGVVTAIFLLAFLYKVLWSDHDIEYYYVCGGSFNAVEIDGKVDWWSDERIDVNGRNWSEVIAMCDSLNVQLKKARTK